MGQKVNPNGFRYGITKNHNSVWYSNKKNFASFLLLDSKIRIFFKQFDLKYSLGEIQIFRNQNDHITVKINTAKPGIVIGENASNIDKLITKLKKFLKNKHLKITLDVVTIEKAELNAKLVAQDIATKLENRGSYRNAQKFAIRTAMRERAKGIKTRVSGRLNGADMSRSEGYTEGEMKLHTLRQNVEYAKAIAHTTYGAIGVKVWISKGDILEGKKK